ncbi:hypothetical protein [Streptomyces sp. NPDC004435]|uniref:hypothetical protein n=1 Tax=Streptomyces sp. NPDC004435 TaxID=3364701 RepID=UPI0036A48916
MGLFRSFERSSDPEVDQQHSDRCSMAYAEDVYAETANKYGENSWEAHTADLAVQAERANYRKHYS